MNAIWRKEVSKLDNENRPNGSEEVQGWLGLDPKQERESTKQERFKNWVKRELLSIILRLLLALAITYIANCLMSKLNNDFATLFCTGVVAGYCIFKGFE